MKNIDIQVIHKPRRKAVIKRGVKAEHYFDYCEEIGCDIWDQLLALEFRQGEPVCLWLPEKMMEPGTSVYVQGVEADENFSGSVPAGFDVITLPEAEYLQFRGKPFTEAFFEEAIGEVWDAISAFDPADLGYAWDEENPRIQLEPQCQRGYMELKAVRKLK